jgi:four helix bundle protein
VTRLIKLIDSDVGWPLERISDNFDVEDFSEKAANSIAADLSEGYGRYSFKENKQFVYYAHVSLFETGTWLRKARTRCLVDRELFASLNEEIDATAKLLYGYIKSIGNKDSQLTNDYDH